MIQGLTADTDYVFSLVAKGSGFQDSPGVEVSTRTLVTPPVGDS